MDHDLFESKLRDSFLNVLTVYDDNGRIVDELVKVLEKDYILVTKESRMCTQCVNCHSNVNGCITNNPYYCMKYELPIKKLSIANDCKGFFGGGEEARKSMARLHKELTGDLFYE